MIHSRSMATLQKAPVSHSASLEVEFLSSDSSDSESKTEHNIRFASFSKRPIVPGRVINLEKLEASHCTASTFFRAKKLSLLLRLCGLELFKKLVCLFYLNLWISADSCEWETLVLGNRIVLNDCMIKEVFGSDFSGDIPFMHGNVWPDQFEISLEDAKIFVAETGSDLSNFDSLVDLSKYMSVLVDATYDTRTFSSMRYVLVNDKWYKKESVQSRGDTPKATRISADYAALFLKEAEHIKLHKDSSTDVGKLCLEVGALKKDAIRSVNTIIKEVNSIKIGADSAHNELAVSMHTSYYTFSKIVERSLNIFCRNVLNTLKYFLSGR
ncbi:hypothetical protein KY284_005504 [Solanum tuberosum]|nr:hypothetical protein KY284_005504 [Solanum tuberosum]